MLKYTLIFFLGVLPLIGHCQKQGLETLDFFIGEWDLETTDIQSDGSFVKGKAKSIVKYILDGHAIQDDFLMIGDNGKTIFWGTSIRSYNAKDKIFQIVWLMPGIKGITDISASWVGDKFVSTGKGYDDMGEFLERFEYFDITDSSYSFKMDRSYDGGASWIKNFGRIEATKSN